MWKMLLEAREVDVPWSIQRMSPLSRTPSMAATIRACSNGGPQKLLQAQLAGQPPSLEATIECKLSAEIL